MGEHNLKFNVTLGSKSREMRLDVPIDLTASEADRIKRTVDELVNTRQPNELQSVEISDILKRHGCTLEDIRTEQRRQRDVVTLARTCIVRYLISEGFSTPAIADFVHREASTVHAIRSRL